MIRPSVGARTIGLRTHNNLGVQFGISRNHYSSRNKHISSCVEPGISPQLFSGQKFIWCDKQEIYDNYYKDNKNHIENKDKQQNETLNIYDYMAISIFSIIIILVILCCFI